MATLSVKKLAPPRSMHSTQIIFLLISAPSTQQAHVTLLPVHTKTTMTPKETVTFKKNSEAVLHLNKRTGTYASLFCPHEPSNPSVKDWSVDPI